MVHRTLVRAACTAFAALSIVGCKDYGPSDPGPRFEVTPVWATVVEGETQQLTITLNGQPAEVTWESSDPSVASVNSSGLVTALVPGFTAVTAKLNSDPTLMASSSITVPVLQGTEIANNTAVTVAAEEGDDRLFRIRVPDGATSLTVTLNGANGDADLYVRQGEVPDKEQFGGGTAATGCQSWNAGSVESCSVSNPARGQWYILLDAWATYTDVTLTATFN